MLQRHLLPERLGQRSEALKRVRCARPVRGAVGSGADSEEIVLSREKPGRKHWAWRIAFPGGVGSYLVLPVGGNVMPSGFLYNVLLCTGSHMAHALPLRLCTLLTATCALCVCVCVCVVCCRYG